MAGQLAAKIRAKYPGAYDDMDDDTLEKTVLEKHPEYKDLVKQRDYYREIEKAGGDTQQNSPAIKSFQKPITKRPESVQPPDVEIPEEQSFLSKAYHLAADPLTDAPSRFARSVTEKLGIGRGFRGEREHPLSAFGAGAIEGLGDVISSLSSPLNLATMLTSGGSATAAKMGLPEIATALNYGTKALSAPVAAHGAINTFSPDSSLSERAIGITEMAGGLAGMKSRIPEMVEPVAPLKKGPVFNDPGGLDWVNAELADLKSGKYNTAERPSGPWESNTGEIGNIVKDPEEAVYNLAREKFNMGRDLPESTGPEPKLEFDPSTLKFEDTLKQSLADRLSHLATNETGTIGDLTPEGSPDLMSEFQKSQEKGPVKAGEPYLDESGNVIGRTTDKEGSTGIEFTEEGEKRFGSPKQAAEFGENQPPSKPPIKRIYNPEELDPQIPVEKRAAPPEYKSSTAEELYNASRGLMSVDLPFMTSAAFRQASPLAWTNSWFKAWGAAAKAYGSEDAFRVMQNEIANSKYVKPRYRPILDREGNVVKYKELPSVAEEAGLKLTDLRHLSSREEAIAGSFAEKIPGYGKYLVRSSNRAYTAFLNDLRKNTFEKLMQQRIDSAAAVSPNEIASFINDATGRGKLEFGVGKGTVNLEQHTKLLSNALFSPRLIASRLKFLNPSTYMQASPMVRAEYIKGLARSIGTWWTLAGVAEMAGATVNKDPNNADFGKIKIGNTRIDAGSGFQQYLVLASRLGSGKFTSSGTGKTSFMGQGFKPRTRLSTAEEFASNKLHPVARFAWDLANASQGKPFKLVDETMQRFIPMMVGDIISAAKTDPELAALVGLGASVGMGTQTYEPGSFNKSVFFPEKNDFKMTGGPLGGR